MNIKMGQKISRMECVDLRELNIDLFSETYTVQRNPKQEGDPVPGERGAIEDEGWKILREPTMGWQGPHASVVGSVWRVYMVCGLSPDDPNWVYGWRKVNSFWPSHLKTWEERDAWTANFIEQLKTLKTELEKAVSPTTIEQLKT